MVELKKAKEVNAKSAIVEYKTHAFIYTCNNLIHQLTIYNILFGRLSKVYKAFGEIQSLFATFLLRICGKDLRKITQIFNQISFADADVRTFVDIDSAAT